MRRRIEPAVAARTRRRLTAAVATVVAFALTGMPSLGGFDAPAVPLDHHDEDDGGGPVQIDVDQPHAGRAGVAVRVDPRAVDDGQSHDDDHEPDGSQDSDDGADLEDPHLPNLVPWHPFHVAVAGVDGHVNTADRVIASVRDEPAPEGHALRFSTTIENVGDHSLEIIGVPGPPRAGGDAPEDATTVVARQCVRFDGPEVEGAERACVQHHDVGTLTYHAHHGHFHIDGFARYELRRDVGGNPMYGAPEAIVAVADKVGFCVQDMWYARGEPGPQPWYRWCRGSPTVPYAFTQGISPGWTDTYFADFHGQQIPLDGIPDGVYWIAITVNPPGTPGVSILEANSSDNTSLARIRLSGEGTEVEVLETRGRGSPSSR